MLFIKKIDFDKNKFAITVYLKGFYRTTRFGFNLKKLCLKNINKIIFFI